MTMTTPMTCFICGHKTLEERCDWEICPVCCWEDDVLVVDREGNHEDSSSSANKGMMVSEAQANFMAYGASMEKRKDRCRPPRPNEPLDPEWKPLDEAIRLFQTKDELNSH
ncbi:MAG: hypothetical protein GY924_14205 [Planctomycetaceae bacterium]|jgi:hypothetical protein|nr:hypothetical protein [Planctomycetaceae bacterium]